jgi:hypothetical protein
LGLLGVFLLVTLNAKHLQELRVTKQFFEHHVDDPVPIGDVPCVMDLDLDFPTFGD